MVYNLFTGRIQPAYTRVIINPFTKSELLSSMDIPVMVDTRRLKQDGRFFRGVISVRFFRGAKPEKPTRWAHTEPIVINGAMGPPQTVL